MDKNLTTVLGLVILFFLIISIGYLVWVGIFWLINIVFGTTLSIWWGGLFGLIAVSILKSIFGK